MRRPLAVLISDVHYNLQNLKLADAAMRMAITKANELNVPLIIAGDLHDTKANLRGECVNAMTETLLRCHQRPYILIGNHDKINEKSVEHSLNFLQLTGARIVNQPEFMLDSNLIAMIPYQHDPAEARKFVHQYGPNYKIVIMHQGLQGTDAGEYFVDHSAIRPKDVAGFRVISGHYHNRQTIQLPDGGIWDYIGNPFTTSYGEANDKPKGFQVLYDDGSLKFVPTNLRKHVIYEPFAGPLIASAEDLVWIKIRGTLEELSGFNRAKVASMINREVFKLDLIVTESVTKAPEKVQSGGDLLDSLIDSLTNTSDERKMRLKELWRHLGS